MRRKEGATDEESSLIKASDKKHKLCEKQITDLLN